MIERADIYSTDLGDKTGSRPAKRRLVLVIQADAFNNTRLATVLVAAITSNTALATMPGNTFLPAASTGLKRDSVVNVTALITLNKSDLSDWIGRAPETLMREVDRGLRQVLSL